MRNKKRNKYLLLLILLLGITIGYATLSTTLKINGSGSVSKQAWSVYWNNVQVTPNSVNASTNIPSIGEDQNDPVNTKVTWSTTLNLPGDFYEFTVDAVNNGSIDAMVTGITPTVTPALEDYIKYTVTYDDGVPIAENHLLPKKTGNTATVQTYKVRIEFLDTITPTQMNAIPEGGLSYTFSYEVTYGQATDVANIKPYAFTSASWDDIIAEYNNGNPSSALISAMIYDVKREIELDLDNDDISETVADLRIANLSKPAECSTQGFSQTACGLVLEFTKIITYHRINPYTNGNSNGDGNKGGWEYSDMRAYLNGTKYLEGTANEIDYTGVGIIDSLPSDLKSKIIDTYVVSGYYGTNDNANFTTTDKLYLLDAKELFGESIYDSATPYKYTSKDSERQLDYYKILGASCAIYTSNYEPVIKKPIGRGYQNWFLRSPWNINSSAYKRDFGSINREGFLGTGIVDSTTSGGVSPAFRIAN